MRLYKLIARHGAVTQRLWPWFAPPAVGAPKRYHGWVWKPELKEWVRVGEPEITVEVPVPRYTKPTETPRPQQATHVPGWYYDYDLIGWISRPLTKRQIQRGQKIVKRPQWSPGYEVPSVVEGWAWSADEKYWVATSIVGEPVGFTPPQSLPPGVTQEAVFELYSFEQLFIEEVTYFVNQGYTLEAARKITRANFDNLIRMMYAQQSAGTIHGWQDLVAKISGQQEIVIKELTGAALLALVAAAVGYLIGTIADRLITPEVSAGVKLDEVGTYLLGPGNWAYSKHVATSVKGRKYYSHCHDIGTEYVRHKRGWLRRVDDIIDFPGGFLETGYDFPYYVKYRWSYWTIRYVGMLESSSERLYLLKRADDDANSGNGQSMIVPQEDWCKNLHYYL